MLAEIALIYLESYINRAIIAVHFEIDENNFFLA